MFTDKKITPRTTDRRHYYAPTENGVPCPNLSIVNDKPEIVMGDDKIRRCVCTQSAPFCSYHLGDFGGLKTQKLDGNGNPMFDPVTGDPVMEIRPENRKYYCRRYEVWYEDPEQPPVDTHNKQMKVVEGRLNWF